MRFVLQILDRLCKKLTLPDPFFFYILVLLNIPCIYFWGIRLGGVHFLACLERCCFVAGCVFLLLIFLPKWLRSLYITLFFLVAELSFGLDIYGIYQYGHPFNAGMMDVIISTNFNEASEYIRQFITWELLIGILVFGVSVVIISWILRRIAKKYYSCKSIATFLAILLIVNIADCARIGFEQWNQAVSRSFGVKRLVEISLRTYINVNEYKKFEHITSNSNTVTVTKDDSNIPYVILIIGESTSRNHMELYNYSLPTTPRLQKRKTMGGMYVFTDVVSHHSHTLPVMRELLTFYRRDSIDEWYRYVNIFDILQKTDYYTAWISNQESVGIYNLDKFYSKRCNYRYFSDIRDSFDESVLPDGVILPILQNIDYREKNFVVVHLMGTHTAYDSRYPQEFAKFTALDEDKGANNTQKKERANYDNAVLYNDYVVDSIIDMFTDKDAIVIYVSDHADEVYEDRDFVGHTESMGTTHMIEIPMIIWASDSFRTKRPALIARIEQAVDRPFMTDDMIHVLLDIMQIEVPDYDTHKSIISNEYFSTDRIYNGMYYEHSDGKSKFLK